MFFSRYFSGLGFGFGGGWMSLVLLFFVFGKFGYGVDCGFSFFFGNLGVVSRFCWFFRRRGRMGGSFG